MSIRHFYEALFLRYTVNLHVCGKWFFPSRWFIPGKVRFAVLIRFLLLLLFFLSLSLSLSRSLVRSLARSLAPIFPRLLNYSRRLRSQCCYREVFYYCALTFVNVFKSIASYFYTELVDLISLGRKANIDYTYVL